MRDEPGAIPIGFIAQVCARMAGWGVLLGGGYGLLLALIVGAGFSADADVLGWVRLAGTGLGRGMATGALMGLLCGVVLSGITFLFLGRGWLRREGRLIRGIRPFSNTAVTANVALAVVPLLFFYPVGLVIAIGSGIGTIIATNAVVGWVLSDGLRLAGYA